MKKTCRLIAELMIMELEVSEGMNWENMESIRGFLVYVARTYRYMNPHLKGMHLKIDSWRP